MTRRKQASRAAASISVTQAKSPAGIQTRDSFQNFLTRTGNRTGNLNDGARYGFNPITRDRLLLEWAYRGSWIAGMAIDCMADDMTREGVTIKSSDKPSMIDELAAEAKSLCIWDQLNDTVKWSRLYGGAVAFMMIDGQDPATPFRADTIKQGQFKGLFPMDRWLVQPSLMTLVEDMGPDFGNPVFYDTVVGMNGGIPRMKVHYSRVIRLEGVRLPYWQRITENLWGESVLERLWDRLIAYDSATAGVAQLVYKAHLRTYKVKGLRELIALGGAAYEGLVAQMNMVREYQSNEGLTIMDAEDEFDSLQYTFAGIGDVMDKFESQIAGALETPRTRLFGESSGGLNSSGDGEEDQYKDTVKQKQVSKLGSGVHRLYDVMYRSKFGKEPPKGFATEFNPLYQMSAKDKAAVTQQTTDSIVKVYEAQIIRRETALKELKALGQISNVFTNISDEEIKEAENDPAPTPEALGLAVPEKPNDDPESHTFGESKSGARASTKDGFDPSEPRDEDGKWTVGSGGSTDVKLNAKEGSYLSSYSGDDFLRVNKMLRDGDASDPAVKHLDSAIDKGTIPSGTTLYRGMTTAAAKKLFPGGTINKGDVVSDRAYASTSKSISEAGMRGLGGVVLRIETGAGAAGLDISNASSNKGESEVLLPRGAKLKVAKIVPSKTTGQPTVVHMTYGDVETDEDGKTAAAA